MFIKEHGVGGMIPSAPVSSNLVCESNVPWLLSTRPCMDLQGAYIKFNMGLKIEVDWVCSHNLKERGGSDLISFLAVVFKWKFWSIYLFFQIL